MPDIKQLKLPNGTLYDLRDSRVDSIISQGTRWVGVTTTPISDGSTTSTIVIGGVDHNAEIGDIAGYQETGKQQEEFIWSGTMWQEFGSTGSLKALAFKDTASGTVAVPKTYTFAGTAASVSVSGTTAGSVSETKSTVTVSKASSGTATYTPQGSNAASSVSGSCSVTPSGSISVGTGTANYTPAGTISLPSLVTTGSVTTTSVATVSDAGTAYTMTSGAVTQGNDSTAKVAIKTVEFAMDGTDAEQLNLSYVPTSTTASGWYTDGVTASGTVSYTAPTLSGSLPTFGTATVADGISDLGSSYNGDPSFTGTGVVLSTSVATSTANATVTQPTFTAAFSGTTKSVTPTVATTENAQAPSGTITLTTTTVSIQTTSSNKTVTVS